MLQVIEPDEKVEQVCEDCSGTTFNIIAHKLNGEIISLHTLCASCGKRGWLRTEVKTVVTRSFVQFTDPPEVGTVFKIEG